MVTRPIVLAVLCVGFFLILQSLLPKTMAFNSNVDRYMMEDRRTQRRKNYMVQRERNQDFFGKPEGLITYENEPVDPERSPGELSAFIVDYANMIRDDVILLDKSVETRTRKRGNIKVKKVNDDNQAISDPPCSCKYDLRLRDLGANYIPQYVEIRNCSKNKDEQKGCKYPYECRESMYDLPILRRYPLNTKKPKKGSYDDGSDEFSRDLRLEKGQKEGWYSEILKISVGCVCIGEWMKNTG